MLDARTFEAYGLVATALALFVLGLLVIEYGIRLKRDARQSSGSLHKRSSTTRMIVLGVIMSLVCAIGVFFALMAALYPTQS
jgi:hypothetical protein